MIQTQCKITIFLFINFHNKDDKIHRKEEFISLEKHILNNTMRSFNRSIFYVKCHFGRLYFSKTKLLKTKKQYRIYTSSKATKCLLDCRISNNTKNSERTQIFKFFRQVLLKNNTKFLHKHNNFIILNLPFLSNNLLKKLCITQHLL